MKQLTNILTIEATLRCVSGLQIAVGEAEMHIGGIDRAVIRNPITDLPYIPGSSLKGKIRSLLEWRSGHVQRTPLSWADYRDSNCPEVLNILQLFGTAGDDSLSDEEIATLGLPRLAFWDCEIPESWLKHGDDYLPKPVVTESKVENTIDRFKGTSNNLRTNERVVAGTPFKFRLSMKVFNGDPDLCPVILSGMRLLELDSLGGSGSRGYGKIKFENLTIDGKDYQSQFDQIDPFKK